MGVPSFLVANTLNLSVAQRLVRLLCPECKKKETFDSDLLPKNYKCPKHIDYHYVACGCEKCYYTGYRGRKAVYEVIPIDYELSHSIKINQFEVSDELQTKEIETLSQAALRLFLNGETTIEEIYPILMNQ
jgi:general secretion pathway protein E/type IV pilus assembly protein PilB